MKFSGEHVLIKFPQFNVELKSCRINMGMNSETDSLLFVRISLSAYPPLTLAAHWMAMCLPDKLTIGHSCWGEQHQRSPH